MTSGHLYRSLKMTKSNTVTEGIKKWKGYLHFAPLLYHLRISFKSIYAKG